MRKLGIVARWVLQVLLAAVFVMVGAAKFFSPAWPRSFERWGFPPGFHLLIGALEVLGGLGLLVPSLASYAALGLIGVMIGAVSTHFVHGETARVFSPLPHIVLLAVVALVRRSSARRPWAGRPSASSPPCEAPVV